VPGQAGNDHPTATPMGVYPTSDGAMNIAVTGARMWHDFCQVIGRPEWVDHPDYATAGARLANRADLNARICAITRSRTAADLTEALLAAEIPCGPIHRIDEVFADPQVRHLGMVAEVEHPTRGRQHLLGQAIDMSGAKPVYHRATPEAGQDTDPVLTELGLSAEEIAALRAKHVI
jgi:crotonobetainyl-CoA:carnitine CoA-transferase CaiB-like acyl-CoA transferase